MTRRSSRLTRLPAAPGGTRRSRSGGVEYAYSTPPDRDRRVPPGAAGSLVRRLLRLVIVFVLLALASAAAAAWLGLRSLDEPLASSAPLRYKVAPGTSFARIASDLASLGVVAQPRAWVVYARWKGLASAVKAGEYEIEPGLTPRSLLAKMVKGDVIMHTFTIVDGWRVRDLLAALRRNPDVVTTLAVNADGQSDEADLIKKLGFAGAQS